MSHLQEIFDKQLKKFCNPSNLGTEVVVKRLEAKGLTVTKKQKKAIKELFSENSDRVLRIEFDDDQILNAGYSSEQELENDIKGLLLGIENELKQLIDDFLENIPSIMMESTDEISAKIFKTLKLNFKDILKENSVVIEEFNSNLHYCYSKPLELLEAHIGIALEAGNLFNDEEREKAVESNDLVFEVLNRLHARACQIGTEVLALLKAGLADGAHARWRTLHEIAVISMFIRDHGNETAERYLLHQGVETHKASKTYQEHCNTLGYEPISIKELSDIAKQYQNLINRYGKEYSSDYGWAAHVIKKQKPTFYDIEQKVGLTHLRPFYKMACNNVHGGATGLFSRLGLLPETSDVMLAGPSNLGLTDPAHQTAISLTQTTTTLILHVPNTDRIVSSKILLLLDAEIGDAFWEAERTIINSI